MQDNMPLFNPMTLTEVLETCHDPQLEAVHNNNRTAAVYQRDLIIDHDPLVAPSGRRMVAG